MHPRFTRDSFTWLAYLFTGIYAFVETVFGPIMPFLQAEAGFSYTVASLHFTAFAFGLILAGLLADRIARILGRRLACWLAAAIMALGLLLLVLARVAPLTIGAVFIAGFGGTSMLAIIQAVLSDRYQQQRATALTESNVVASLLAILAPLLTGALQQAGYSWRLAPLSAVAVLAGLAVLFLRLPFPRPYLDTSSSAATAVTPTPGGRLPGRFWAYWAVMLFGAAVEWCMVYWSAGFLQTFIGLSAAAAATTVSLFFIAQVAGRFIASRLTRLISSTRLLLLAQAITLLGIPLFWLAPLPALSIAGFFLAGLGIANFYPLTLSVAVDAASVRADAASARLALAGGIALSIAPLAVGNIADLLGLQRAYSLVIALLLVAIALTLFANRLRTSADLNSLPHAANGDVVE